jgi:dihydropteroate synthase
LTGIGGERRPCGVLRLGRRVFGPDQLLVEAVVCPDLGDVRAVVAEGADIVEIPGGPGKEIAAFIGTVRDAYPDLVIGVSTGRREVGREACAAGADLILGDVAVAEVAAEFGAGMVCPDALVGHVVGAGVDPDRIIVEPAGSSRENVSSRLAGLVASGWPVLVDAAADDGLAGALARTAVCAWLGVRVFRAREVRETRRVLRMVSAIRGDIPPARAVRGLA